MQQNTPAKLFFLFFALVSLQVASSLEHSSHPCSLGICGKCNFAPDKVELSLLPALQHGVQGQCWLHSFRCDYFQYLQPFEPLTVLIRSHLQQFAKRRAVGNHSWIPEGPKSGWVGGPGEFLGFLAGLYLELELSYPCLPLTSTIYGIVGQHKNGLTSSLIKK